MTRMPSYFGSKTHSSPDGAEAPTDANIGDTECAPVGFARRRVAMPLSDYLAACPHAQADFRRLVVAASRFFALFLLELAAEPLAFFP